jgi:hypothetical protein
VIQAAGAYNGTVNHPNLHYAAGVQIVADYARKVIERAADLNRSAREASSVDQSTLAVGMLNIGAHLTEQRE